MSAILISDLPVSRSLDRQAMARLRGGAAPWVFGWIQPYARAQAGSPFAMVLNFYQTNNNFYADQMVNQFQNVNVNNSGSNSNVNVNVDGNASNTATLMPGRNGMFAV